MGVSPAVPCLWVDTSALVLLEYYSLRGRVYPTPEGWLEMDMSFAMCGVLGFLGNAGQMPQQISPLPTRWALSASSPGEGLLPSGSSLYASKYHLHAPPYSCWSILSRCLFVLQIHQAYAFLGPLHLLLPQSFTWLTSPFSSQLRGHVLRPGIPAPQPPPRPVALRASRLQHFHGSSHSQRL